MNLKLLRAMPLALLVLAAITTPAHAAYGDCETAQDNLSATWESANHEFTPAVAYAIKEQLDACPSVYSTSQVDPTCSPQGCVSASVRVPLARECGFGGPVKAEHPGAAMTAWYQAGEVNQPEPDRGDALATYLPSVEETTYHIMGEKWGLDASSTGAATIYLHGVALPATGGATAGCSVIGKPELCWAKGFGEIVVRGIGGIAVTSSFTNC